MKVQLIDILIDNLIEVLEHQRKILMLILLSQTQNFI